MSENLMGRVNALGERLKIGGAEVGRKMSAGMSSVGFKVKEFFQDSSHADKLVGEATSETLHHPHWPIILHLCDLINGDQLNTAEAVRAIKKRVVSKSHRTQYLALVLLEALVKNCDKAFLEVATERVLDEMVKLIDDPYTFVNNRNKALMMIEAWGESTTELRYLPVYAQTFKSLKSRGILFPGRDNESLAPIFTPPRSGTAPEADVSLEHLMQHNVQSFSPVTPSRSASTSEADVNLAHLMHHDVHVKSFTSQQTEEAFDVARNSFELLSTVLSSSTQKDVLKDDLVTTLVQQCRQSQTTVHRIIETSWDNEALLCEALNINDEIEKVVKRYEEMKKKKKKHAEPETATEDYEAPHFTEEEALVRKSGSSRCEVQRGNQDDMLDDLDEMIFGKRGGFDGGQYPNKQRSSTKDDLISF
ncbi:hypothetical protein LR48_Vigan08g199300 [Vigna angularis]|uniref:VHS domain-containing protein n=2 Tax=Phaseolus angularis TaxID=3914 RepID=A0A0L9V7X9_PHAAN|nr:TOM1-like protein 1 [Vigna angularis]KOM51166.1 hypothetical protein LR48_Vigan08g199300 [Vigna angularis]BAT91206.1 hypothetical protein VIGAN_06251900 [Vigna angularis var. angularis]